MRSTAARTTGRFSDFHPCMWRRAGRTNTSKHTWADTGSPGRQKIGVAVPPSSPPTVPTPRMWPGHAATLSKRTVPREPSTSRTVSPLP